MRKLFVTGLAIALFASLGVASVDKLQQDAANLPGDEFWVGPASPAATQILEDFEGGTPPAGWTVTDNCGGGVIWASAAFWGMTNNTNGSGEAASCDSDAAGSGLCLDTELITPSYDFCGATNSGLNANLYYENLAAIDFLDIDVSLDKGATWTNVLSWNEDHGTEDVSLDLSAFDGQPTVTLRVHYYDPSGGGWVWYAQVDNFELTADGTIVEGQGTCTPGGDGGAVPATSTTGLIILAVLLMLGGSLFVVLRRRTA